MLGIKTILDWLQASLAANDLMNSNNVYPSAADGATITSTTTAWGEDGTIAEIVPADTIVDPMIIKDIVVDTISADDDYELIIYTGAASSEVEVGRIKFSGNADKVLRFGRRVDANARVSGKLVSKGTVARTANISIQYVSWS